MKSLVLAEKPSVAKELARVLGCTEKHKSHFEGPKYVVTWALGHLVELCEPEDYDVKYRTWNLADLPIAPERMKLKPIRETTHQYKAVAQLCKRSDIRELIIATDAGREGELVARWLMELVQWRRPVQRLWISSQTDKAIREGFARLRPGAEYEKLYASAVCRAEADWLIGLNVTRALTSKFGAQLAAGRVQTPTLAMLMEREREIRRFTPVPYWTVTAEFGGFTAAWRAGDGHDGRLFERAKAETVAGRVKGKQAVVETRKTTEKTEPQPLPYDLTELQRDANKRHGFSAKHTSSVLQRLYEQHKLVTYPRTDSRYLSADLVPTLKPRLEAIAVDSYGPIVRPLLRGTANIARRAVDDAKVTDHHAIIPTEERLNLGALSADERKLYDLIARRFIALFLPVYRYEETSLTLLVDGERFYAKGRVQKEAGWRDAYGGQFGRDGEDDDGEDDDAVRERRSSVQPLPPLQTGHSAAVTRARVGDHQTKPPARYTEASLLTQMEQNNLGTPATRADIIEKLLQTDTIERQQNRLVPTGKGQQLIELVPEALRTAGLTAEWERELERIAKGSGDRARFMADIRRQTEQLVADVKTSEVEYKPHNLTTSKCPECGKPMMERNGKRGRMLICSDRDCGHRKALEPALSNKRCPQCHKRMEIHTGKAGKYAQCRPCNLIESLDDKAGGRAGRKAQNQLVQQYSDSTGLTSSLGDVLLAALQKQKEE